MSTNLTPTPETNAFLEQTLGDPRSILAVKEVREFGEMLERERDSAMNLNALAASVHAANIKFRDVCMYGTPHRYRPSHERKVI